MVWICIPESNEAGERLEDLDSEVEVYAGEPTDLEGHALADEVAGLMESLEPILRTMLDKAAELRGSLVKGIGFQTRFKSRVLLSVVPVHPPLFSALSPVRVLAAHLQLHRLRQGRV